jgi:hypothetical protein
MLKGESENNFRQPRDLLKKYALGQPKIESTYSFTGDIEEGRR